MPSVRYYPTSKYFGFFSDSLDPWFSTTVPTICCKKIVLGVPRVKNLENHCLRSKNFNSEIL